MTATGRAGPSGPPPALSDPYKTPVTGGASFRDMKTPRLDLIGLVVADMAASLAFYRRLGFGFPEGADKAPHVEAVLPGGLRVAWDTEESVRSFDPSFRRGEGSRGELAFRCDTAEEVDAAYAELTAAGYAGHLAPWDAVWGQRYAVVTDPDGYGISLFADVSIDSRAPGGV